MWNWLRVIWQSLFPSSLGFGGKLGAQVIRANPTRWQRFTDFLRSSI